MSYKWFFSVLRLPDNVSGIKEREVQRQVVLPLFIVLELGAHFTSFLFSARDRVSNLNDAYSA